MPDSAAFSNYVLAGGGTLVAAAFVAVQAFYAHTSYVEAAETRFLEKKLDICFENFDVAARLDASLRLSVPGMMEQEIWLPEIVIEDARSLTTLQREVVPMLNMLEAGLTKASVLGELDKFRTYMMQQLGGLSKRLLDLTPAQLAPDNKETKAVFASLSKFLGVQYSVFTGCRLVAEGKA